MPVECLYNIDRQEMHFSKDASLDRMAADLKNRVRRAAASKYREWPRCPLHRCEMTPEAYMIPHTGVAQGELHCPLQGTQEPAEYATAARPIATLQTHDQFVERMGEVLKGGPLFKVNDRVFLNGIEGRWMNYERNDPSHGMSDVQFTIGLIRVQTARLVTYSA